MSDAVIFTGVPVGALPMGAYRLRTEAAKHGYDVQVIDFSWALSEETLTAVCAKYISPETKIVGLSSNWVDVNWRLPGHIIGKFIKDSYPQVTLIEGGQRPQQTVPQAKWWFRGFSDVSWIKFLDYVYRGAQAPAFNLQGTTRVVDSDTHYTVTDYDSLGTTWLESDPITKDHAIPIEIGRGCVFKCSFCHHPFLGKKKGTYTRSATNIAEEFRRNHDLFGTTRYQFIDDTFNDSEEKIRLVLDARDKSGVDIEFVCYARAEMLVAQPQTIPMLIDLGLRSAHVGIESFNMVGRKAIGKGLAIHKVLTALENVRRQSNNRVSFWATFIAGLPGDTPDSVMRQAEWCHQHRDTHLQGWWHYPLNITPTSLHLSEIEKNPAHFGYTITEEGWSSETMTSKDAAALADIINRKRYRGSMRAAGYLRAYGWGCGLTDEQLDATPFLDVNFSAMLGTQADAYFKRILA